MSQHFVSNLPYKFDIKNIPHSSAWSSNFLNSKIMELFERVCALIHT